MIKVLLLTLPQAHPTSSASATFGSFASLGNSYRKRQVAKMLYSNGDSL